MVVVVFFNMGVQERVFYSFVVQSLRYFWIYSGDVKVVVDMSLDQIQELMVSEVRGLVYIIQEGFGW